MTDEEKMDEGLARLETLLSISSEDSIWYEISEDMGGEPWGRA